MKINLKNLWQVILGLCIGNIYLFGLNPLAAGYLTAVIISGDRTALVYISIIAGISAGRSVMDIVRYSVMLLIIALILNIKQLLKYKERNILFPAIAAGINMLINLTVSLAISDKLDLYIGVAEAVLTFGAASVFAYALKVMKEDYVRIYTENQSAIAVLVLMMAVLYGMPGEIIGGIVIRETFAILSILFVTYKFGLGLGITWTVAASGIMYYVSGEKTYFAAWIILAVTVYGIMSMLGGGRIVFSIVFGILYYSWGIFIDDFLIREAGQKAFLSALFIFMLVPARLLLQPDYRVKTGELMEMSSEWGKLVINRINNIAAAFKRLDYTLAGEAEVGVGFNVVGNLIEECANELEKKVPLKKTIEAAIVEELAGKGIQLKNLAMLKNSHDKYEIYLSARVRRGRLVSTLQVKEIIENETKLDLELSDESRLVVGRDYGILCFREKTEFVCKAAVKGFSRYEDEVSGDNFFIGDTEMGQKLVMISDGMGNGERASRDSRSLIEALEEFINAGFDNDTAIHILNSCLADKNRGESFTTLDMLILDLYTGYGKLFKQGAATTFIKRNDWIEMIKSTSLPVGVIDGAVCEKCVRKFYNNDIIVMVSDGVIESVIFENKEEYIRDLISDSEYDEPDELAEHIMAQIKAVSGNRLQDDATIIVLKLETGKC